LLNKLAEQARARKVGGPPKYSADKQPDKHPGFNLPRLWLCWIIAIHKLSLFEQFQQSRFARGINRQFNSSGATSNALQLDIPQRTGCEAVPIPPAAGIIQECRDNPNNILPLISHRL